MTRLFTAKPFVVAEVGSNWRDLGQCIASIEAAKRCGADAVKFQAFNYEALYGLKYSSTGSGIDNATLPLEWLPNLKRAADALGIEFMCTAFSPELVAVVDPFVSVHKVASSDATWPQMLEAVAKTGKPSLVSFGAKTYGEIGNALKILGSNATPMRCVAAYPADFYSLGDVGEWINWGLSDHSLGYSVPVYASKRACLVIEKHFTAFPDLDTPDRPHSLTPAQFTRMVKLIRGEPVESEETAMFLRHNRRLIATSDIEPGQHLRYGVNFGAYRSLKDDTRGASPLDWEKVNGRMAKGEIKRGASIALEDVE